MAIDRRSLVGRHDVHVTEADPGLVFSVGNGDFAFTADITGLPTFSRFHEPVIEIGPGASDPYARRVANTCTMSTWGWHEAPNLDGYSLDDVMSEYQTRRGPVAYPDRMSFGATPGESADRTTLAGLWLFGNPHRLDLGRLGLVLRPSPDAEAETDPSVLTDVAVHLDLWRGVLRSRFTYLGQEVHVTTTAHPDTSTVATRIVSPLLATGQLAVRAVFGYACEHFALPNDWASPERHSTGLEHRGETSAVLHRTLDSTRYDVALEWSSGVLSPTGEPHRFVVSTQAASLDVVASFKPVAGPGARLGATNHAPVTSFDDVLAAAVSGWEGYWMSGGAIDTSGSTDPRAEELERRVVLSQYLTRVHSAGLMPPQETGLVTNSWMGKAHLEMHWWHAAHFAAWGRPELLEASLAWYETIHPMARATAARQGYAGARWPKQIGPDGREAPSDIGALLVWQQPHLIYFAELLYAAHANDPASQARLLQRLTPLIEDTAAFMADFADGIDDVVHLGPPLMPAQEFYDTRATHDPTFELAYWWFGLEVAQRWRQRQGLPQNRHWSSIQARLAHPTVTDGHYAAVAEETATRTDDHPSMMLALGFVPPTPLVDTAIMRASLTWVLEHWQWDTAWGWDFPVMAMTATRLGEPETAVNCLLYDAVKNRYDAVGHNPQMGSFLPLYLPGNGGVLSAVSLMVAGWHGGPELPGIPGDGAWHIQHEGLVRWPGPLSSEGPR